MIENTVVEKQVLEVMEQRWAIGRERYGEGIESFQHDNAMDWLDEAIEECADQLQYLVATKIFIQGNEVK